MMIPNAPSAKNVQASGTDGAVDAIGTVHGRMRGEARIVSLVPSLTELLFDLGLGASVVGRTGFCVHPRAWVRTVRKVGGTKDVRLDAVRRLEPTHVVVNIDENRRDTVEALAQFVPNIIVTHPCTPEDNRALYRLFGHVFDRTAAARRLEYELDAALGEAGALAATVPPEAALYLIWREPWMTVARDTYISAMLDRVGWRTLPEKCAERYPVLQWGEEWVGSAQRILLPSEPYRFRECHVAEVERLARRPVVRVDGEMVSWYGSRAIAGLRYLTSLRRSLVLDG